MKKNGEKKVFVNGLDLNGVQHSYALFAFFTATDFVLQEIAIDDRDKDKKAEVLKEAEELHLCALALSTATFGQMNIQVQNTLFNSVKKSKKQHCFTNSFSRLQSTMGTLVAFTSQWSSVPRPRRCT